MRLGSRYFCLYLLCYDAHYIVGLAFGNTLGISQRYTYRVLKTIQMKRILLCVWVKPAVLGSAKTALEFKYEIEIGYHIYNSMYVAGYKVEK